MRWLTSWGRYDPAMSLLNTVHERERNRAALTEAAALLELKSRGVGALREHHIHFSVPSPLTFVVQCINGLLLSPFIIWTVQYIGSGCISVGKQREDRDVAQRDERVAESLDDLIKEFSFPLFSGLRFVWRCKMKQMTHWHCCWLTHSSRCLKLLTPIAFIR